MASIADSRPIAALHNPLVFPKSNIPFGHDLFQSPTSEYRGCPLWAWNNRLRRDQLLRQIDYMSEMGLGGFHIHSRTGLETPYMGPEFMGHVRACAERAAEKGMLACLYDEDRWPSGYGGGLVTKDQSEYRALHLLLTPRKYDQAGAVRPQQGGANANAVRSEQGHLVARYEISFDPSGTRVVRALRLDDSDLEGPERNIWYAYVETNPDSEWFNTGSYVDSLNKKAVSKFIETTHDVYATTLSDLFGTTVPSIFTDEPQFAHKTGLRDARDKSDVFLPWTNDISDTFRQRYGYDLLNRLPDIIWDIQQPDSTDPDNKTSPTVTRYHFHDHICERFVDAFMDNIAGWCRARGIFLIGHMMKEPTLRSQTEAIGEAMRCYRSLDVPGIDMLTDLYEFNTVKQCSSVARQSGTKGVMCEIYGVTNWTFDFAGHKASGDWQAALGVTFRVHHLTWVSMAGEGKRDYPACIGYQSNWYKQYPTVENHFARLNVALTRGSPVARVAVIHPIESFWLCFGPMDTNAEEMAFRDQAFEDLTKWLIFGLVDFDFVSESLLPEQCSLDDISSDKLPVGHMQYDVVIVPNLRTIRSTTLERLERFASKGGRVFVTGSAPTHVDAVRPTSPSLVSMPYATPVPFTAFHILQAIEPFRDVRVRSTDESAATDKILYQLRDDGSHKYLFLCNTDRVRYYPTKVEIRGVYDVEVLDTLTGESWRAERTISNDWTAIDWHFEAIASVLFKLTVVSGTTDIVGVASRKQFVPRAMLKTLDTPVSLERVVLSEPNVLLLDYCTWRIEEGAWSKETEVLRAENDIRRDLRLPLKLEALRQPWSQPSEATKPKAEVTARFLFTTQVALDRAQLAIEDAANVRIALNGVSLSFPTPVSGWWVDEDIHTVALPTLARGKHVLELTYAFGLLTNLERVYLLGSFSVDVRGRNAVVKPFDRNIDFGDWTTMGLPFYAGDITYHCSLTVDTADEHLWLEVPRFVGPVLQVEVADHATHELRKQIIATEPRIVDLGRRTAGDRVEVGITCFGNRENAFGTVHKPDGTTRWVASNAWRAEHELWMEEYNVKRMGVLQRPRVKALGEEIYNVRVNPLKRWIL